ncbi:hypothetical protein ACFSW8_05435 [Rubritalea tangerina]|uniref:Uncharacterized protein n=2 Tax=Rubritalea tangerina TaxID=430798 RepID=A0ABW4Z8U2_9BACT
MHKTILQLTCPPRFRKKCPVTWNTLTELDDSDDRWCTTCKKQVHRTDNPAKLKELADNGKCVAVLYGENMLLGHIDNRYTPPKKAKLVPTPPSI